MNKSKIIIGIAAFFIIAGILSLKYLAKDVNTQTEFDKLKEAAKHCTNPVSADPKCLETFSEMQKNSNFTPQKTAQGKVAL